jgi:hypothetical protein
VASVVCAHAVQRAGSRARLQVVSRERLSGARRP